MSAGYMLYAICVRATAFRKVPMSVILISNTTATGNRDNISQQTGPTNIF